MDRIMGAAFERIKQGAVNEALYRGNPRTGSAICRHNPALATPRTADVDTPMAAA
jgi:hypothetical protein